MQRMEVRADTDSESSGPGGFALTQADIDEFKGIVRRECGVEMSDREAWSRVIELLSLYRMMLGPIPEDPEARPAGPEVQLPSHLPDSPIP